MSALELKVRTKEIHFVFNTKETAMKYNTVDKALLNCMVWNLLGEHFINFICNGNFSGADERGWRWASNGMRGQKRIRYIKTDEPNYFVLPPMLLSLLLAPRLSPSHQKLQSTSIPPLWLCECIITDSFFVVLVITFYVFTFCFSLINILMNFYIQICVPRG